MKYNIPFIKPSFPPVAEFAADYKKILASNWYTNFGPIEREFSSALEQYIGQDTHLATVSNATLGLIVAIGAVLGRGDGDSYVLMPSFTFVAGAQALIWCGYKPYFVDINATSLQMDVALAEQILHTEGKQVRGILFCNAFGVGTPDIDAWEDFAAQAGLPLIIDSAAGFGSRYADGTYLGARGDCEVFSFHATKPFAIGEGGAVSSRDPKLIEKVKSIQNFGFQGRNSTVLGLNGKLQEINAAIGLRQLEDFTVRVKAREGSLLSYRDALGGYLQFQYNAENSALCFAAAVCGQTGLRDKVVGGLRAVGIQAREYYNPPIHAQTYFRDHPGLWKASTLAITEDISGRILSLPIHDHMTSTDLGAVNQTVKELINE